jgi:cytochrome b559 alpha subunit
MDNSVKLLCVLLFAAMVLVILKGFSYETFSTPRPNGYFIQDEPTTISKSPRK